CSSCSLQPSTDDIHHSTSPLFHWRGVNQRPAARARQRLVAGAEGHLYRIRAAWVTALARQAVDPGITDITRWHLGQTVRMRLGHEGAPYLQRPRGAGKTRLAVIITAQPGHCQQIIREAGEPAIAQIVGCTRLA